MRKFLDFKYEATWLLLQSHFQYGITDTPNKSFKKLAFLEDSKRKNNLSENIVKLLQVGWLILSHKWHIGRLASYVDVAVLFGSHALDPVPLLHQR